MPVYLLRFHSPSRSEALAGATLRAAVSISATASSAADTMLEVGALTTLTPFWVAALTSTLSRPTPARAITLSRPAAASASGSTFVALRTRIASTSAIAGSSSARSAPLQVRISKSGPSASTVAGLSSSAMSTTGLLTWIPRLSSDRVGRAPRCARGRLYRIGTGGPGPWTQRAPAVPTTGARDVSGSARGRALGVVGVVGLHPRHQLAQVAAGGLDGVLLALGAQPLELRRAGVLVVDEALRERAVLDLAEDAAHPVLDRVVD